jgi:hypothetical protein
MTRPKRIHSDASKAGDRVRTARCGWIAVDTETDVTKVTCEMCKRALRGECFKPSKKAKKVTGGELNAEVAKAFARLLAPIAGPPPRLTPGLWASVCRERRCGSCVVCDHERDIAQWAHCAPWRKVHVLRRAESAPKWGSLNAALIALAEYEAHERTSPSAMGFMLARCARGDISNDNGGSRPDDPQLARADDVVHVRQALAVAYPDGAHAMLTARECIGVLLSRTPGALPVPEVPYEDLAQRLSVSIGDLKALVKEGRRRATVELAARGLIPAPPPSAGLAEAVWAAKERRVANG